MEDPAYQTNTALPPPPAPAKREARCRFSGCFMGLGLGCLTSCVLVFVVPFILIYSLATRISWDAVEEVSQGPTLEERVDAGLVPVQRLELRGMITGEWASYWHSDATCDAAVLEQIRAAIDNEAVKGLLIVLNSPGGSVTASDNLYHALERFKAAQPGRKVFVMGGDLVASGAYYLAMQADVIRVQPTSVVGSIGVIMPGINIANLAQTLGIADNSITSGASKDIANPLKPINPEHNAILKSVVDDMYKRFVEIVAKGRKMPTQKVMSYADGRVYPANEAKNIGLVDEVGYEDDFVASIAEQFGCKQEEIYLYSPNAEGFSLRKWAIAFPQAIGRGLSEGLMSGDSKVPQYRW